MKIIGKKINFNTKGNGQIINLTDKVARLVKEEEIKEGIIYLFVPGATGALTTLEYEPGLVKDFQNLFKEVIPEKGRYFHNLTHSDRNAHSHLRASLVGPSLYIPFEKGCLQLGKWQQIIFLDFDNRARKREIIVKITGE